MKPKKLNPGLLWMQFEDVLAPRLGLTVKERAVYSYLLRHSLVVGKIRLRFAVIGVARALGLSNGAAREAVRRLDELGALRVLERGKTGHFAEMRLPEKIRAIRVGKDGGLLSVDVGDLAAVGEARGSALEAMDFRKSWALRKAIHERERGVCFYCLRRTVFTAFGARCRTCGPWTMWCRACALGAIRIATWFPAVSNATRIRATGQLRIFCARSTAKAA